jgi:hypothetical protein
MNLSPVVEAIDNLKRPDYEAWPLIWFAATQLPVITLVVN